MDYEHALSSKGLLTGHKATLYSDNLLIFRLKKLDPTYKDNNKVELQVGDKLGELMDAIANDTVVSTKRRDVP
jgi:hypothetical protein